jgi:type II secretory pathway component GspD/PulD (secretin)
VRVFSLQYAKAKDVEEQLKPQLNAKGVGSIHSDERTNQVVIQTLPERMEEMEDIIESLDKKTLEVVIDAKVVKVDLSDRLDRGIEWEGLFDLGKNAGLSYLGSTPFTQVQAATAAWRSRFDTFQSVGHVGSYPFSRFTSDFDSGSKGTGAEHMHLGIVSDKMDFDTLIRFIETIGDTRVLSNPKLVVVNHQEARIHVGDREAYVTTTTTTGQTTSTISEEVTFVDVGIQLSVTPHINDDGYITMKIKPEVSSVIATLETPSENRIPIINTSLAETTVMVKDGITVIIGGLREDREVVNKEKTPYLSDIPVIGWLFQREDKTNERSELLVLLTPHIITGDIMTTGDETDFDFGLMDEYRNYKPDLKNAPRETSTELRSRKINQKMPGKVEAKEYGDLPSLEEIVEDKVIQYR